MRFSVFTAATPDWTPAEAAERIAAQGWDGIEWRVTDQDPAEAPGFWAGNRATWPLTGLEDSLPEIARITREAGLEFSGIGGYAMSDQHEDVRRMLDATATLGARQVRVRVPFPESEDYRTVFARTRRDLEAAVEHATGRGVKVLVELHHRTISSSASAAFRLVDGLDPAHIGVIHDLGNLLIEGQEDTLSGLQILGEYLAHVHVKNALWARTGDVGADGDVLWEAQWATLREGIASVPDYFRALAAFGYDGWVTLEDFSTALPLEERLADDLAYLRSALAASRTP
ncbi:sugar phosphate isomerase/epimerase [Microbacterium resistens]|uniref:Sugar phosphate isomerase/epimerase n=1 Tax=Microbacterium resistens TaxID=156977 RepID=A0ABU1SBW7_9MICO|nr:sugar phosphate isomerase/epimerase family protein [Microbacterium resistens]MDR6867106.1 sugar phosphate isomerase/epimerase [Microbacterium resistens]